MAVSFNTLAKIRQRGKKQIERKMKNPPVWFHPTSAEDEYRRILYRLARQIRARINEILVPQIPLMIVEVNSVTPEPARGDDFLDRLRGIMLMISKTLEPDVEEAILGMEKIGLQISDYNMKQFNKMNKSVFGLDIFIDQPWLKDQLELFASQNSQLIKSIPEEELFQVAGIVERRLQEGRRFEVVEEDLIKRFGITRRRAKLIARDQTTKLNASLTKLRQQELGVTTFRWQTSNDERVRESHRVMDGKVCKWDDPNVWLDEKTGKWVPRSTQATKNQVGVDINCRCVAIAQLEGVLD